MPNRDEIAAKVKDRFPLASVDVAEVETALRLVIAEPGHRTLIATMAPEMVDTGIHLLWISRNDAERACQGAG